jgi:GAF domain-containing protein
MRDPPGTYADDRRADDDQPQADAIRRQLARIVRSSAFRDASQLTSFLTYVVEATLAGSADRLKAYTIATQALGRSASFDPQTDPIVRVEAGRLRQALARYYADEGRRDPVVVAQPRGSYVPVFRLRGSKDTTSLNAAAPADRRGDLLSDALLRLVDLCQLIPDLVHPAPVVAEDVHSDADVEPSAADDWYVDAARLLGRRSGNREGAAADGDQPPATADARAANAMRLIAMLDTLSAQLLVSRDVKSAVETILDAAITLHSADFGTVQLLDEPTRQLVIYAQRGFGPRLLQTGPRVSTEDDWACARALRLRKPVIVTDVRTDPGFAKLLDAAAEAGYRAVQSTPLIASGGNAVGVVSTYSVRPHRPSMLDMLMTRFYGRLAADLLERLAHGGTSPAAAEPPAASPAGSTPSPGSGPLLFSEAAFRTLDAFQGQLRGAANVQSVAETIVDGIVHLHKSDFASVQLFDELSDELFIVAQRGFRVDLLGPYLRIAARPDQYLSGRAACSRTPIVIDDAFAAVEYPSVRTSAAATGYRAVQATPMITSEGRLVGVMATHFARAHACARLDMPMTQFYARLAANALVQLLPPPGHGISLKWPNRAVQVISRDTMAERDGRPPRLPPSPAAATNRVIHAALQNKSADGRQAQRNHQARRAAAAGTRGPWPGGYLGDPADDGDDSPGLRDLWI